MNRLLRIALIALALGLVFRTARRDDAGPPSLDETVVEGAAFGFSIGSDARTCWEAARARFGAGELVGIDLPAGHLSDRLARFAPEDFAAAAALDTWTLRVSDVTARPGEDPWVGSTELRLHDIVELSFEGDRLVRIRRLRHESTGM